MTAGFRATETLGALLRSTTSTEIVTQERSTHLDTFRTLAGRAAFNLQDDNRPLKLLLRNRVDDLAVLFGAGLVGRPLIVSDPAKPIETDDAVDGVVCAGSALLLDAGVEAGSADVLTVESVLAGSPTATETAQPDEPFLLLPTSGSTGPPRLAVHHQASMIRGAEMYRSLYPRRPGTVLLPVPMLHSFGLIAGFLHALAVGDRPVILSRFTPAAFWQAVERYQPDLCLGSPLLYQLLARGRAPSVSDIPLDLALVSGGPLKIDLQSELTERFGFRVRQAYGSTETGLIAAQRPEQATAGYVGAPAPGVEVDVVDDELLVRTPGMFLGYHGEPPRSADAWYPTGDQGEIDGGQGIRIVGRKGTFINVGGKKVNPVQVETVLETHPLVTEAMVLPLDRNGEQQVVARIVVAGSVADADLSRHCRRTLAAHEIPLSFERVDRLDRTMGGKLRRVVMS